MKNKNNSSTDVNLIIYDKLGDVARSRGFISYSDLGELVGLHGRSRKLSKLLDDINRYEHQNKRPMLSAVVISVVNNSPGRGFFNLARKLGVYQGNCDLEFFVNELHKVRDCWSSS